MHPRNFEPAFCSAVLRTWNSAPVRSVLMSRGVLRDGIAKHVKSTVEFGARQSADIDKHGLGECSLPSCGKAERTVREFAACSSCRLAWYCCKEHQALHWTKHKRACRGKAAVRNAEATSQVGGGDGETAVA